jgi:hypothetical protein
MTTRVTYTTGLVATVAASGPVVVLHQRVQYPANAERRLDDVGRVFPDVLNPLLPLDGQQILANLDLAIAHTRHVDDNLAVLL